MSKKQQVIHEVSQEDKELYLSFTTKIVASGFVPAEELKAEYGPDGFTKCIATLFRTHRMLREVRRPWKDQRDALGYEWADRRFSQSEVKKLSPGLQVVVEQFKKASNKYTDFERIAVRCRWTNKVFGAMPREQNGDKINVFDRANGKGSDLLIPAYCVRAMVKTALPLVSKEAALGGRIKFKTVRVPASALGEVEVRPIIDPDGHTGLGLQQSETIEPGTEFVIDAMVPTSVMQPDEFVRMLRVAGEYVHLSPARSSGFGDFEVVELATE